MSEELQILLMHYADGTLDGADRVAVEAILRERPELAAQVEEDQKLIAALRADPLPRINWEALANHIGGQVDQAEAPANPYSLTWVRSGIASVAIAACVIIGLLIYFRGIGGGPLPTMTAGTLSIQIDGPEAPAAKPVELVEIGPPPGMSALQSTLLQSEAMIARPSRVIVAGVDAPPNPNLSAFPF